MSTEISFYGKKRVFVHGSLCFVFDTLLNGACIPYVARRVPYGCLSCQGVIQFFVKLFTVETVLGWCSRLLVFRKKYFPASESLS